MSEPLDGGTSCFHRIEFAMRMLGHGGSCRTPAILIALSGGPLRYTELHEQINALQARWQGRHLSEKALSGALLRMVRDQLVVRHRTEAYPPSTWYKLTPQARDLLVAVRPLADWAQKHRAHIAESDGAVK